MPTEAAPCSPSAAIDYVRLHITPLDADVVNVILPASVRPRSRNLSFHTIQTFPENRYGFVDLPRMDAGNLKRKLNGSLLKGTKIRVEDARPEERTEPTGDAARPEKKRKILTKDKPKKIDPQILEGVTLKDRKVKRGWTEKPGVKGKGAKDKDAARKRQRSRYTDKEECLLKVKVPPCAMGNLPADAVSKKKKEKGKSRHVVVHEFEKTTNFPSFLKFSAPDKDGKAATEFVEGKGWVDDDGTLVETVRGRQSCLSKKPSVSMSDEKEDSSSRATSPDSTSSSGTSSEDETEDDEESSAEESTSRVHEERPASAVKEAGKNAIATDGGSSPSPSSPKSLTIKIPRLESQPTIHPLEALYKRPQPGPDATKCPPQPEPFSFFGGASGDEDDAPVEKSANQSGSKMPMTPFTRQDFEQRGVRSAAPTPDTAHPSRKHLFWGSQEEDDEDKDEDEDEEADPDHASQPQPGQSDFQTWFWENRRELNRSWMTRRKTAAKEKRHRENKARTSRAA
ncbi:hypothetical protein XA68_12479 [Ophiocordyceps unilateralis]|uniref:RRM domain-containing protein n=1 Tax=Ophiocordyceps unilateralis TaxID=268505 RepID=A0A2A9PEN1_OPHUN|nr:hypothetical protein XA68_12479 [Ophiocordyceps unilateralis]